MDCSQQEVIYELLSNGIHNKGIIKNFNEIVSTLRKIHFELVEWYDKSCYILVNTGKSSELILGYNEEENKEIEEIFKALANEECVKGNLIFSLVENGWIDIVDNTKYLLSKRTLVVFKNKILEWEGKYKACKFCNFLVFKKSAHDFCQEIFDNKNQF